jgi:dCMP deaminase
MSHERAEFTYDAKWNERFLSMAELVASWSKDPSTKCGAVIVRPDKTVASVGFNGFPIGCDDSDELYEDRDQKLARVVHAEQNALLHTREALHGYTIYTAQIPNIGPSCDRCTAHIIQAGIGTIAYRVAPIPERWKDSINRGLQMYQEAGVNVVQLNGLDG